MDESTLSSIADARSDLNNQWALTYLATWPAIDLQHSRRGTAMGPEIEIHRDVAIRYGYSIRDDVYYAHFDFPEKPPKRTQFQTHINTHLSPAKTSGKGRVQGQNVEELLRTAKGAIDKHLDE
jgi:hypothetical protein